MTGGDNRTSSDAPAGELRQVPVAWEALEDAFENNAPEVHSYLHLGTGEVLRVVDGVADPGTHARIAADSSYLRVDPVSSREQYRWMERFIPMVDDLESVLQQVLHEGSPAEIVAGAVHHAVADGQHLHTRKNRVVAHEVRRYRISTMASVSASCGSTRHPCSNGRHCPTVGGVVSTAKPSGVA